MASPKSPDTEKWKAKYYNLLDRFEKQETDWIKSEKLLSSALTRVSFVAEGNSPEIDKYLQALRAVLKEKFNLYRVEAVLTELMQLTSDSEKKSKNKKEAELKLSVVIEMLAGIRLPKEQQKKKKILIKELKNNPQNFEAINKQLQTVFNEVKTAEEVGLFSRLLSKKTTDGKNELTDLSAVVLAIEWPDKLLAESKKTADLFAKCSDAEALEKAVVALSVLLAKFEEATADTKPEKEQSGHAVDINREKIKQDSLNQLIQKLKQAGPENAQLQTIELSDDQLDAEPALLAETISRIINSAQIATSHSSVDDIAQAVTEHPELCEVFIQLLEQIVVPVALLDKADALRQYLESAEDKDWRAGLKKIVHFINEVRFQQYQEEGDYEDFLQEITGRLQELVQFLVTENEAIEQGNEKGKDINRAVTIEVDGLREGVESAATLSDLQSVVNTRLDAISNFMLQHSQLEKERFDSAKSNVAMMQDKINALESETAELKVSLAEKHREAMYDALTGIPNRLFYEKRIKEDIARWKRFDTPLSIAVWDVDKFKAVNDTYGHKAGDKVLKAIAQILNKRIRETDFLARYGGEEFVMLLPGTVEEETLRLANELRQAVSECAFHYNNKAVDITISCGISGFRADDNLAAVFERADQALYQAKEAGRNRCVIAACRSD